MATYAAFDQEAADRKRKAIQRLRAAAIAARLLHEVNQQRAGVPGSPTPPKPVMPQQVPHTPPRVPGPTPGRPIADPGYPGAGHPPPRGRPHRPVDMSHDVVRQLIGEMQQPQSPQGRGQASGRGQVSVGNLATGRPYQQPPEAHMPERRPVGGPDSGKPNLGGQTIAVGHGDGPNGPVPIPGVVFNGGRRPPNLGGLVKQPHLPQLPGRPQVNPLDEQLAAQRAEMLGRTQRRPRSRRGADLLAHILGRFSQG